LADLNQGVKDYISSINSDLPVDKAYTLFLAGQPVEGGWNPSINIVVEPNPAGLSTLKSVLEGEIEGIKSSFTDFQELSQVDTTVGGREAVILEWEGSLPNAGEVHDLQMFLPKGKTIWTVTCAAVPENYGDSEDTFHNILSSFRISK